MRREAWFPLGEKGGMRRREASILPVSLLVFTFSSLLKTTFSREYPDSLKR